MEQKQQRKIMCQQNRGIWISGQTIQTKHKSGTVFTYMLYVQPIRLPFIITIISILFFYRCLTLHHRRPKNKQNISKGTTNATAAVDAFVRKANRFIDKLSTNRAAFLTNSS